MKKDYRVGSLLYDADIYDGMNTNMEDLPFYKKWLSTKKGASILELCCGTGRLTVPLAKEGLTITGVDFTSTMLERARERSIEEGLEIEFFEADMRSFNLKRSYDLIFIPFNSIHHLYTNEDLFNTLSQVKNHLKDDGLFIFDCFNPNIEFIVEGRKQLKTISEYQTKGGTNVRIDEIMSYESDSQINRIEWHYFINDEFDSIQNLDMRMYFPKELDSYLKFNGFEILQKFGDFSEERFSNKSDKQILVCKKSQD